MIRRASAALLALAPAAAAPPADFARDIRPLIATHCLDCHDAATRKSGLDLERFTDAASALRDRATWGAVLEKIESLQMPPPKREALPTADERATLVAWIRELAAQPDPVLGARDPGRPVLRRLTRLEYNNTVRDLLRLPTDVFMFPERLPLADKAYFRPASGSLGDEVEVRFREFGQKYPVLLRASTLPGDNRAEHGYRNRGDAANFSPLLLEGYVALAAEIVDHPELPARSPVFADFLGLIPPPAPAAAPRAGPAAPAAGEFAAKLRAMPAASGAAVALEAFRGLVAAAHREGRGGIFDVPPALANQTTAGKGAVLTVPYGRRALTINPDIDLWTVAFSTAEAVSGNLLFTNRQKGQKTMELTFAIRGEDLDEGIETLGVCVLGRRGQRGRVVLTAVTSDSEEKRLAAEVAEGPAGTTFFSFAANPGERILRLRVDGSGFSGDHVLLDDLAFVTNGRPQAAAPPAGPPAPVPVPGKAAEGVPVAKTFPPAPDRLAAFLERAYRRPPSAEEAQRYLALYARARESGDPEAAALRLAAKAILASPGFLFLAEPAQPAAPAVRPLGGFELASRLSYFLWAAPPDAALLEAARTGRLGEPGELAAQARRMLRDPRIAELGESFAVQWLRLDQLHAAKPDPELFKAFYAGPLGKDTLHAPMLAEALLLFETVLVEDRSILDFIAADYTWLNPRLARAYGLTSAPPPAPVPGGAANRELRETANRVANTWKRTPLSDPVRGGFFTMAGPLTVTSLPFRTSPVKRGAWLLETIFNRPPQEPKVAFAIEDDTREAAAARSIREKFEAHRSKPACYSCHVRLDPPGFALERFDPIGRWREREGGRPVDARGEWHGEAFDGPAGFKAALRRDPAEFTRGFIEHLLGYALGRKLDLPDAPAVAEIQAAAASDGHRLGAIISGIVRSYPFRHTRNVDLPRAAP